MGIANPRVHVICGFCGNGDKDLMSYEIKKDEDDKLIVSISCENCSSLTGLDEVMKERKKPK